MAKPPYAPKDLIVKRSGPPAPPIRPSDSQSTSAVDTSSSTVSTNLGTTGQSEVQSKLEEEAQDLIRTHTQVVSLVSSYPELQTLGNVLTDTLQAASPQACAIFAPLVDDFRNQSISLLNTQEYITPIQDGSIDSLSNLIGNSSVDQIQQIVNGLQTAVLIASQTLQSQPEKAVQSDAIKGYKPLVQSAMNAAELIASLGPVIWRDLSHNSSIVNTDLSQILRQASDTVFSSYAASAEQVLALHATVRTSSEKNLRYTNALKSASAYLAAANAGLQASKNPQSGASLSELLQQAAVSTLSKDLSQALQKLTKRLLNPYDAPQMSKKVT